MNNRDDFSKDKAKIIAERAAYLCSNPNCRMITSGPHSNESKSLKIGVAAHICAAASGGPRYNPAQTPEERASIPNGIWLCHSCSDLVDKDPGKYTKELLHEWKITHSQFIEMSRRNSQSDLSRGGNGGEVFIFADHISGDGEINVNGGNGQPGGDAGKVHIESRNNYFTGKISATGGKSLRPSTTNNESALEEIYSKSTGAQLRFLLILREAMRFGGKGMDCGYVSNYFQHTIAAMTNRYRGWITPFISAYLQEKGLVTVNDNFFSLTKFGDEFINFLESRNYPIQELEL